MSKRRNVRFLILSIVLGGCLAFSVPYIIPYVYGDPYGGKYFTFEHDFFFLKDAQGKRIGHGVALVGTCAIHIGERQTEMSTSATLPEQRPPYWAREDIPPTYSVVSSYASGWPLFWKIEYSALDFLNFNRNEHHRSKTLWAELIANSLFFSFCVFWILWIPRAIRERLRLHRGRCRECGYDIQNTPTEQCPECGKKKAHS